MNEIKAEHKKLIAILIGAVAVTLIVGGATFYIYNHQKQNLAEPQTAIAQPQPTKTDFGTATPPDFPTNIPIEKGAVVNQSYSLDYAGQKQLTIVFPSTKTVAANYALYADFLKTDGWTVSNKYESAKLSSLYATKEINEINVTISESVSTTTKSQLSISVLKK